MKKVKKRAKKTVKKSIKKTSKKTLKKGSKLKCYKCGMVVKVDEICGCVDTCDIICCGKTMKRK